MAVSATFNVGDLSPYVKDSVEDPSDLRTNPSEEGEVNAGACTQGNLKSQQGQGDQAQGAIQALFSFTSSRVCTVLGNHFEELVWRCYPSHDWTSPTLLNSLTCLLLQG